MIIFPENRDKIFKRQNYLLKSLKKFLEKVCFYELCTVTQSQVTINFSYYIPGVFQSKQLQFSICLELWENRMNHFMIMLYQKAQEIIKKSLFVDQKIQLKPY